VFVLAISASNSAILGNFTVDVSDTTLDATKQVDLTDRGRIGGLKGLENNTRLALKQMKQAREVSGNTPKTVLATKSSGFREG
jgi:hypothetical protein